MRWRPPRWPVTVWVLRGMVLVLPTAALLVALPTVPHLAVLALVLAGSARWAILPEDVSGVLVLLLVLAWWAFHDVTDLRLVAVGTLLASAHVAATLASYGPGELDPGASLVLRWVARLAAALVPLAVSMAALHALGAWPAPSWWWSLAIALFVGLLAVATWATSEDEA